MERPGAQGGASQAGFTKVSLYRADGSRIVVEEDGDVWVISGNSRRLVRTLSPAERMALDVSLGRAGAASWGDGALSGARVVIHGPGGRTSIAAGAPEAARIVEAMEGWLS